MQQTTFGINQGFLLKGDPDIGRIAFQRFAEKPGRCDTDDGQRMALGDEC